jgi:hypothetical protein
MRKVLLLLSLVAVSFCVNAQVATNGGSGLNPTYPDLATAITALNGAIITDPVIITLTGNETAPNGTGYYITATGTVSNTITIQGSSSTITAGVNSAGGSFDAIFKIVGGDYITIQNFTMQENAANAVITTGVTNTMTEMAVLLIHGSATDGAQNNTIQNNAITLNSTYTNSVGILSTSSSTTSNASPGASTVLDATSTAGTNSNNKFYGNTISNVAYGMYFICPPLTTAVFETGNDIGGSAIATGNSITFGNATASSGPWNRSVSTNQAGIVFRNGAGNNIRFTTIVSNSAAYVGSAGLNGIQISSGTAPTSVTYTSTISDNTITLTTTGVALVTGIDFGHGISTGTIVGSNNSVTINQTGAVANAAAVVGIKGNYTSAAATANANLVVFNQTFTPTANSTTNSSAFTGVTIAGTSTTLNANNNTVTVTQLVNPGTTITAATLSGQMTGVSANGAATTVNTNNNIVTINQTAQPAGTTATAVISSTVLGINSATAGNTGAIYSSNYNKVTCNQSSNILASGAATVSITGQFNGIQIGGSNTTGGTTNALGDTVLLNRTVSQIAGQTTTLANATTSFIGISATTVTTTLNIGSQSTAADQNIVQVREGTSATGTVTYNAGSITMLSIGSSSATTSGPVSTANVLGNRLNTGSTVTTTTGSTIRSTGAFSAITIPNQGALNTVSSNSIIVDRVASSAAAVFGIQQSTSPSQLADSVKNNTVTFTNLAGSAAPTGISSLGGVTGGAGTSKNINNNTINISGTHTGASTGFATNFSSGNINFNTVTINSVSATVIGINWNGSNNAGWTAAGNTFSLNSTTTAPTSMAGISGTVGTGFQVFNNTISALNFSGVITGSPVVSGVVVSVGTGNNIYNNIINNITVGAATSTATPTIDGVLVSGGTSTNVYKNKIYGITTATTGVAAVNGIRLSGGTTNNIHNNLIGGLTAPTGTSTDAIRGISITSTTASTTHNIYYNTIYLSGGGGTNFGATGIFHTTSTTATTSTLNLRNNIIVNACTPNGTGLAVAFRRSAGTAGTLANYGSASNNNLFYAGTPSANNLIYSDGTSSAQTISAYKSGVFTAGTIASRDAVSFSENPTFLSTVGANTGFLHIDPAVATQIESGAANIATYTDDFDGDARNGSTPDVGADEGTFTLSDLSGPSISYTAFPNTACAADRTISVTISDASSVNTTAGTKPRLYFRKTTNANTFNDNTSATDGWKYVEASNAVSPFSFTTNYSLLFGSTPTVLDVIEYFVVAQDMAAPNFSINTGTLASPSTTVALVTGNFPVTGAGSFTIVNAVNGTVTIGAAGTYTSLTGASGLFNAINTNGISTNVTANIIDASVTENGTVALNAINYSGCSAGPFTVTVKATTTSVLSGSSATAIITLNGADYVIIDGSSSSTVNTVCPVSAASRDLTITNTNTGTSSAVVWLQTAIADGATNNTIKNCNLVGNSNTTTLFGVGSGGSTISATSLGTGNNNNSYINNNISKTQIGIYSQGASISSKNTGTVINQNLINTVSPNNVQIGGIRAGFESGIVISGNNIANMFPTAAAAYGIALGVVPANTYTTLTGNEVVGAEVSKNVIDNVVRSGDGSSYGIVLTQSTSIGAATSTISNNMISGVRTTAATPSDSPFGIEIGGGTSATNVYSNTVVMTGLGSSSSNCFGIAIGGSNPVVDMRNNIIVNKTTSATGKMYALGLAYTTYTNLTSNNNDFFVTADANHFDVGVGSFASPSSTYALSAWVTAANKDALSKNIDPTFLSATNLHIDNTVSANLGLNNAAATGTGITDDIDCGTRGSFPDIGADQFGAPGFWTGETSTDWNTTTNWDNAAVPTSGANITVPTGASNMPALDIARTVSNLALGTSTTLNLNAQIFTINGAVTGTGTLTGSSASSLIIGGIAGTVNFTSGSRTLKDLTLAASATATLGTALDIVGGSTPGTVTIDASGILTTGGNLTLKSDGNGTARIASMATGGSILGTVTQERFIPAKLSRTYSLVASPFSQEISSAWQQQVHITGTGTGGTVCPTLTAHSNGFDATVNNAASMFVYDGTKAVGSRWTSVTGTIGVNLAAGTGYRMNIRGPRSIGCSLLDGTVTAVTAATLSSTGTLTNGNKNYGSFAITLLNNSDASIANDNYLLTGNPYPSQVSFAALQTANSGIINNSYAVFAPGNPVGNYAFWDGATWTGANTGLSDATGDIIANGQAFFVKGSVAGANVALGWTEGMKTSSLNNGYFRQLNPNRLRIGYILGNDNKADEIMIQFAANASSDKLNEDDVVSINTGTQNLKSIKTGNGLAFNTRNINFSNDTVRLNVISGTNGSFKLSFYDFDELVKASNTKIYLLDNYTGTVQLMNDIKEYPFTVNTADAASQGTGRFAVVFSKQIPTVTTLSTVSTMKAYPNPMADNLTVELPIVDGGWTVTLVDMSGKVLIQQKVQNNIVTLTTAKLAKGSYSLQAVDSKGNKQVQKLVKQ